MCVVFCEGKLRIETWIIDGARICDVDSSTVAETDVESSRFEMMGCQKVDTRKD